jgi:hypothetical protein
MPLFPAVDMRYDIRADEVMAAVSGLAEPVVFKGAVADWSAVKQAQISTDALIDYLKTCDNGHPAETFRQMLGGDGKYFYDDDPRGFNFQRAALPIKVTLERLRGTDVEPIYIQSALLKDHMPRFKAENQLPGLTAEPRIWIGNRSLTQTHFDINYNLACMIGGHKRFVLFPPEQTANLYMGPIETTVSGVPTSMASLENPDFERHPRFAEALKAAVVADLEPGDVLYVPYMWWHHVSSSGGFNVQVNYWWNTAGAEMGVPMQTLLHAMLSLRDLPPDQNAAWKAMFDQFVFHQGGDTAAHLPPEVRGILGNIKPEQRQAIRAAIGRNLQD